ncbi:MAG: hypothetical protein ACTSQA_00430 [Candidatus Heimdallarchaeaceae archaeon]
MITQEERDSIINEAVEKTLLSIPEVIGNLMANHAALHKINNKFYKDHPEFSTRRDIVQTVVEMVEGKNPTMQYEDILEKAVPEIKRMITISSDINVSSSPAKLERNFSDVDMSQNGCV